MASKNRVPGQPVNENCMIVRSPVLTHCQRATDGQTDTPPVAKSLFSIAERDKNGNSTRCAHHGGRPTT